jgi:phenylpropionate dioxygenase-like ring-hydroxylating dioxygenase large terminal subunit
VDSVSWNDWHVIAEAATVGARHPLRTRLLNVPLVLDRASGGKIRVMNADGEEVLAEERHGFVWACLGHPTSPIVDIPEAEKPGMITLTGGAISIYASAGRVIENFLDLGHLGFVHAGYLGAEPDNEVTSYNVEVSPDSGIVATNCVVLQPNGGMAADGAKAMNYTYRVKRPFVASFDKEYVEDQPYKDTMYIFAQPASEERTIAHTLIFFADRGYGSEEIAYVRQIMQFILLQDKPILENQFPKRLPIGPGMEMPILADKTSVAYRRWLAACGVTFGTLSQPAELAA